ncbi:MAG: FAD-binding protein [Prosthecobacter sp.]|nr:FAD-binding protein [Prosthecobacter sp.]
MAPASLNELIDAVRATPRLLAVGAGTKPRLSAVDVPKLSMTGLTGIGEYDPGEFTFTAMAGTPVREIADALSARGQYLPFDPMLLEAGSTLGGTVASGLSGPGRFRYGGIRDFILGVRFVDGAGRLLRMGGKVVKNAAGFDLPKFFVGSLGRFGVLAEMTFKVFPRASWSRTLKLTFDTTQAAARALTEAANTRWEVDALDLLPDGRTVLLRLTTPEAVAREVLARWPGHELSDEEALAAWAEIREFRWANPQGDLVKVPLTPDQVVSLHSSLPKEARIHVSAGGNVAYVSMPEIGGDFDWAGVTLRGSGPLWHGRAQRPQILEAVKEALDPEQRFPSLDD